MTPRWVSLKPSSILLLPCQTLQEKTLGRFLKLLLTCSMHQVRVWNTKKIDCTNISSPTVIRKRVTAPKIECPRSASHERATTSRDVAACNSAGGELPTSSHSPLRPRVLEFGTPESAKKRAFSLFQEEALETLNSPGAQTDSPSSVLNPPPSLKRKTIRDYFASSTSWIWHFLANKKNYEFLAPPEELS
jgi:denticleless